jgi:hypothetical protein
LAGICTVLLAQLCCPAGQTVRELLNSLVEQVIRYTLKKAVMLVDINASDWVDVDK